MPIQIAKQYDPWEALGTGLGTGVQKGVSEQLKEMAELRLKGLQGQALTQLLGGTTPTTGPPPAEGAPPPVEGAPPPIEDTISNILKSPLPTPQKIQLIGQAKQSDLAEKKLKQQRELAEKRIEAGITGRKAKYVDERLLENAKEASQADAILPSLDEYERILKTGETGSAAMNRVTLWFGKQVFGDDVDMDWLLKQDDQILRKLSVDFLRKDIKGMTRPSQVLIRTLIKGNPNIFTDPVVQQFVVNLKKFEAYNKKAHDRVQRDIAIDNPGISLRELDRETERVISPIKKGLEERFLPQLHQYKVGQSIDKLPSPLEAPIGAQFAHGKYIVENTGLKFKKVGLNPKWKG